MGRNAGAIDAACSDDDDDDADSSVVFSCLFASIDHEENQREQQIVYVPFLDVAATVAPVRRSTIDRNSAISINTNEYNKTNRT